VVELRQKIACDQVLALYEVARHLGLKVAYTNGRRPNDSSCEPRIQLQFAKIRDLRRIEIKTQKMDFVFRRRQPSLAISQPNPCHEDELIPEASHWQGLVWENFPTFGAGWMN
jgi:hypothetical protein